MWIPLKCLLEETVAYILKLSSKDLILPQKEPLCSQNDLPLNGANTIWWQGLGGAGAGAGYAIGWPHDTVNGKW